MARLDPFGLGHGAEVAAGLLPVVAAARRAHDVQIVGLVAAAQQAGHV
ncbi:hypothetical protein ABEG18_05725 [Alsobacter sp. KACC 23698]|uniref:Glycosyltransferase family 1 protein n=1 Tax=Alsobacter sp. KACC 23698 TaxID=3149229 RepID=A0AAU7JJD5_9HYPH